MPKEPLPQLSDAIWTPEDRMRGTELLLVPNMERYDREMRPRYEAALARQEAKTAQTKAPAA